VSEAEVEPIAHPLAPGAEFKRDVSEQSKDIAALLVFLLKVAPGPACR
jgi:hypothetical protein